jgi:hypothetical protein
MVHQFMDLRKRIFSDKLRVLGVDNQLNFLRQSERANMFTKVFPHRVSHEHLHELVV